MKKSYLSLGGMIFFLVLLIVNLIFEVSPENNTLLGISVVFLLILFLIQKRKERST